MVLIGQIGCIRASDCNRAVVVFGQSGCILANMVVIGKNSLFGKKWL